MSTKTKAKNLPPGAALEAVIAETLCTLGAVANDIDDTIPEIGDTDAFIRGGLVWRRDLLRRAYTKLAEAEYGTFHEKCVRERTAGPAPATLAAAVEGD